LIHLFNICEIKEFENTNIFILLFNINLIDKTILNQKFAFVIVNFMIQNSK